MKQMASALPPKQCPPNGRYPFTITAATPGFTKVKNEGQATQKGGDSKISLGLEIAEGEHLGFSANDELGTDGGTRFGSMSKKRLRQLDVPGLDADAEIPDEVIATQLLGRRVWAECEREQREDKDGQKLFDMDEKTGLKTPVYRLRILGYLRQPTAGAQQGAPGQQMMPQGMAPQGYAPQAGAPQYAPPPGMPQYAAAPGAPQGWPGAPQAGYAPPAPGAVPGGYAPQAAPGFPQVAPPPGWGGAPQNGAVAPGAAPGQPGQPGLPFPGTQAPGR